MGRNTFLVMEKPKYQIGDRVGETNLIVCGYLRLSNGSYRALFTD